MLRETFIKYAIECIPLKPLSACNLNCANYLAARLEGLNALRAGKTFLMVCIAHCRDDFAFDVLLANGTFGSESLLIIRNAIVVVILREESADGQRFLALDALKATLVEVFIGHTENFTRTLLLALSAVDFCFTCRTTKLVVGRGDTNQLSTTGQMDLSLSKHKPRP